jgi:hypothetical protein
VSGARQQQAELIDIIGRHVSQCEPLSAVPLQLPLWWRSVVQCIIAAGEVNFLYFLCFEIRSCCGRERGELLNLFVTSTNHCMIFSMAKFSCAVSSSRRKNRKAHFGATSVERRVRMSAPLSKDLFAKYHVSQRQHADKHGFQRVRH